MICLSLFAIEMRGLSQTKEIIYPRGQVFDIHCAKDVWPCSLEPTLA